MTDDIGWGDLGSYGGGAMCGAPTPNLDRLAAEGMRFVNHYQRASCTAGRASKIPALYDLWWGSRRSLVGPRRNLRHRLQRAALTAGELKTSSGHYSGQDNGIGLDITPVTDLALGRAQDAPEHS
jgi:arylsulfatase A-like enzyme